MATSRTLATAALVLGAFAVSAAQDSLNLTFPDNSARSTWIQDGYPNAIPKDASPVKGSQVQLAIPPKTPGARVFVLDNSTGMVADKKISEIKDFTWDIRPSDFTEVAEVRVAVSHDGKPVAAASVDFKDAVRTQSQILDGTAKGVLSFYIVKAGKIDVKVSYRSNGAMATPVSQSFDLAAKAGATPTFKVALPDPVETVNGNVAQATPGDAGSPDASAGAVSPPGAGAPVVPQRPSVQSSPFGTLIVVVIVLVVALTAGYSIMQYMKKNPEKTKAALEQLGVQIPKAPDDDLNAGIPAVPLAAPAAPQPIQKIMLGDSSPDPLTSGTGFSDPAQISLGGAAAYGGSAVAASPQLRSASGEVIPISDTPLVVGRDPGLGLSLVGESTVSRRHAEVIKTGAGVVVKDLGSTNGTYVNGAKLQGETTLHPGDDVQFGAIRFRYEG